MRIPLDGDAYVNFRYPAGSSVRHAVAITSIGGILQRSMTLRFKEELEQLRTGIPFPPDLTLRDIGAGGPSGNGSSLAGSSMTTVMSKTSS